MQMTIRPDDPSRVSNVLVVTPLAVGFGMIFLVLRLYVRLFMTQAGLGPEDWTIIAAGLMSLGLAGLTISLTGYGWAHHIDDISPEVNLTVGWKLFYCTEIVYFNALTLVKCSILFLVLRLAPPLRYAIYSLFTVVILFDVATTLVLIFQCKPISFAWVPSLIGGTCIDVGALYITNGVINILSDLIIYALPIRTLWRLRLPKKQRIGLVMVFSVGLLCVLAALLRINALTAILGPWDPQWTTVGSILWSNVEVNVGIVCASLACLKPLISKIVDGFDTVGSFFSSSIGGKLSTIGSTIKSGTRSRSNSNTRSRSGSMGTFSASRKASSAAKSASNSRFGSVASNWGGPTANRTVTEIEVETKALRKTSIVGSCIAMTDIGSDEQITSTEPFDLPVPVVNERGALRPRPETSHTMTRTQTRAGEREEEIHIHGGILKRTEVWVMEDRV